ncbi:MAG: DUF5615 family PIN-like protein [Anaerolineae bacterium]|nr:DUF5615 family PIN-like protein [Anaerolineae bacterium]
MARLYTNENFPQPCVEILRTLGHDVLTTLDAGNAGQSIADEGVLDFARDNERVLVTFNRKHFLELHRKRPDHAGIIVCTVDTDFEALANRVHTALASVSDMRGQLLRVNRPAQS